MFTLSRGEDGLDLPRRCKLFGIFLRQGRVCLRATSREECLQRSDFAGCFWDATRGRCDVYRRELKEEFAKSRNEMSRLVLKRGFCSALTESSCSGDCAWDGFRCNLKQSLTVLALNGDDCPLQHLMRIGADCGTENVQRMCIQKKSREGLQQCNWRRGFCEVHPTVAELGFFSALGMDGRLAEQVVSAQQYCTKFADRSTCGSQCAPPILSQSFSAKCGFPTVSFSVFVLV